MKIHFFSPDETHGLLFFQLTCPTILAPIAFTHTKAQSLTNMNPQQSWRVPTPKTHLIPKLQILKILIELQSKVNPKYFRYKSFLLPKLVILLFYSIGRFDASSQKNQNAVTWNCSV